MADPTIRCAIYTRKSTDEGLDQSFNSLDAQREACAAYVLSQRHEGWTLVPEIYEDGGYSGGTMNRPGLQHLMADIEAGKVNVILVYKVDRLTRSLADFAKMVDIFDAAGVSFVSITQSFNTTTSMGRLTLNVLLSFAQFEREVTAERIRDKIAASKQKGMWMGGTVPFGYRVENRKLIIVEEEAEIIRKAMKRYIELGSVRLLADELEEQGVRTRIIQLSTGATRGGVHWGRGGLRHLLNSRLYLGEIEHKGECYPGDHEAIVTLELWQQVRDTMAAQTRERKQGTRGINPSLLSSLVTDGHNRPMYPSHAVKAARRYRYYITHPRNIAVGDPAAWRMPAHDLERGVIDLVADFLADGHALATAHGNRVAGDQLETLISNGKSDAEALRSTDPNTVRAKLLERVEQVQLAETGMAVIVKLDGDARHTLHAGLAKIRRSNDVALQIEPRSSDREPVRDEALVALIAEAHAARKLVMATSNASIDKLASQAGVGLARFKKLLRISCLAPVIVESIIEGRQSPELTVARLNTLTNIPHCWTAQAAMLKAA